MKHLIAPFIAGVLVGGLLTHILLAQLPQHSDHSQNHHDNHPIADPYDDEYHVHADFHIVVNNTLVNLDDNQFQTTSEQELHSDLHLHDNNGDVEHIHAENKTFAEFLDSLDITLTDSCLTLDNTYCSGETEEVLLFVNGDLYTQPISTYIPVDDDSILLYYGIYDESLIAKHLGNIPDDSCYYSGTCPNAALLHPRAAVRRVSYS